MQRTLTWKYAKWSGRLAVIALPFITVIYVYWLVYDARAHTQSYVEAAYARWGSAVDVASVGSDRIALLLKVEDPAFFKHQGVDLDTPGAGMTTLTQALVKLLYFPQGFRPGLAKIRQTLIARYVLNGLVSKEEQLRLFLNIAYFGTENGQAIHGFGAAARTYFDKPLKDLTDPQFLSLVAMLMAPNALKPGSGPNLRRVQSIDAFVSGERTPTSLMDVGYEGEKGRFAQHAMVALLRLITQ